MDMEIVGRHALLFDDDTTAAFVNSEDALVEWNSLLIDRYDVRHLLSSPPPSRRRRNPQPSHTSSADTELDYERYLDLPSPSYEQEADVNPEPVGGFNAVPFSYINHEDSNDQKNVETESECPAFHPPFPVPDNLIQYLPPTEKVHQIITRTALFVSKNGGQSEIVLRVKQGDNPTFGFLMPDHHLHPYFRFLVDHQDLLQSKEDGQPENDQKTSNNVNGAGAGALSLLGSVYGTGEDEDGGADHASSSREYVSGNNVDVDGTSSLVSAKPLLSVGKVEAVSKHSRPSKEDAPVLKRNSLTNALKAGWASSSRKGETSVLLSAAPDKLRASSLPPIPKTEQMLLEPPSDVKLLVDKIVEFIIKNGRQFEAVLMEQDRGHGRFPFLNPSNKFHLYYLKVLQKAQESKLTVKSFHYEKEDSKGHVSNKKTSISKESETGLVESDDIPLDSERKEKFKMVINKSKREGSDFPSKSTQQQLGIQVDAAQAAAILQAATRGVKHPNLDFLSKISKTAAKEVANEADSSEASLTHEQKLKAERLKRAKMFVAMLKNGKAEPTRGVSAEPQGSGASGFGADISIATKERERSSAPSDLDTKDRKIKSEKEHLDEERRAKRKYRARGEAAADEDDDEGEEREGKRLRKHRRKKHRSRNRSVDDESEEKYDNGTDHKHGKKRHRSHRSSHKHDDKDKTDDEKDYKYSRKKKHRSPSSFYEDEEQESEKYSRRKHQTYHSSHNEGESDHKYSRKKRSSREEDDAKDERHNKRKHRSHKSSHHSRDRHKHRKSHSSTHRKEPDVSTEEELDHNRSDNYGKGSHSEKELEEGEISPKVSHLVDGASREPSVDVSSSYQDRRPPTQPSETTDVPDDLRAKIRAMLMSTL